MVLYLMIKSSFTTDPNYGDNCIEVEGTDRKWCGGGMICDTASNTCLCSDNEYHRGDNKIKCALSKYDSMFSVVFRCIFNVYLLKDYYDN